MGSFLYGAKAKEDLAMKMQAGRCQAGGLRALWEELLLSLAIPGKALSWPPGH